MLIACEESLRRRGIDAVVGDELAARVTKAAASCQELGSGLWPGSMTPEIGALPLSAYAPTDFSSIVGAGRGSVVGSVVSPVVRVCANPETCAKMPDDMDVPHALGGAWPSGVPARLQGISLARALVSRVRSSGL